MAEEKTGKLNFIAVDSSVHSERAFKWYCSHLHQPGVKVGLIHVHQIPSIQVIGMHGISPVLVEQYQRTVDDSVAQSKAVIERFEGLCKERQMDYVSFCRTADDSVGHTICNIAKENGAEMIIIGQRGLGTIRRTLLGSVSDYVVHHAHIPTIVVPHESEK